MTSHIYLNMLRFLRCYYLHFTRHSELLRGSLACVRLFVGVARQFCASSKGGLACWLSFLDNSGWH